MRAHCLCFLLFWISLHWPKQVQTILFLQRFVSFTICILYCYLCFYSVLCFDKKQSCSSAHSLSPFTCCPAALSMGAHIHKCWLASNFPDEMSLFSFLFIFAIFIFNSFVSIRFIFNMFNCKIEIKYHLVIYYAFTCMIAFVRDTAAACGSVNGEPAIPFQEFD